jgi:hypothetical protein
MTAAPDDDTPETGADEGPVVLLAGGGPLAWIVINGLKDRFPGLVVLREQPERVRDVVRRRARLIGWPKTLGQAAFGALGRVIAALSRSRIAAIHARHGLDPRPDATVTMHDIGSVNSPACRAGLRLLAPRAVLVCGTRLIGRATLSCIEAPFINCHAGVTPKYRGRNGAYWALASGDAAHAGVTLHLVDGGVETGPVLYQSSVAFERGDNIAVYPHRQMSAALPLVIRAAEDALAGRIATVRPDLPSRQWFTPTLWGYLATGIGRGVW